MKPLFLSALFELLSSDPERDWSLEELALKSGYSKYHLCRAFQAAAQEPLQTYLRRLKLARAAAALQAGDRIIDVAVANGYQSQEAFHRAFTKMFCLTPKAFQQGNSHPSQLLKKAWHKELMPPPPLPVREERREAFELKGMGGRFSYEQIQEIEALWQRFSRAIQTNAATFGVTLENPDDDSSFLYFASVKENADIEHSPSDTFALETIHIPAQEYKVFRFQGAASSMLTAFNYIWGIWLPEQKDIIIKGVDFEYYPPEYDPLSEQSWVDIYIPIVRHSHTQTKN